MSPHKCRMELLENIAMYLKGWRLDKRGERLALIGPNLERVVIIQEKQRFEFIAFCPRHPTGYSMSWKGWGVGNDSEFRIGCSISRNPKAIAADLERRLLKRLIDVMPVVRRQIDEALKELEELNNVYDLMKRFIKVCEYGYRERGKTRKEFFFDGGRGEIGSYNGGYVSLSFERLSYEDGIKLAAFFNQLKKQ